VTPHGRAANDRGTRLKKSTPRHAASRRPASNLNEIKHLARCRRAAVAGPALAMFALPKPTIAMHPIHPDARVLLAMQRLISHWEQHPLACDDAEGMHRWWFGATAQFSVADLTIAAGRLASAGAAEARAAADGRLHWRRAAGFDAVALRRHAAAGERRH
jgi:hypothetical protein